jgi:secreted PhoX family phosphatase
MVLRNPTRRHFVQAGGATLLAACSSAPKQGGPLLGFTGVPLDSSRGGLRVPDGTVAGVVVTWGEPVNSTGLQLFNSADGQRTLLAIAHDVASEGSTPDRVRQAQEAVGLSVLEVAATRRAIWQAVQPSPSARRINALTPCSLSGPAAGHLLMRSAADASGRQVLGALGLAGVARTPWGTCLASEGDWAAFFDGGDYSTADQRRSGLQRMGRAGWAAVDARFDARKHPTELNRFGWVLEFDPTAPASTPVKRTALGRGAREGLAVTLTRDQRAVVYLSDGAAFEYVYKFVSRDAAGKSNAGLLDEGTLYVARFEADGSGRWMPLLAGQGPLLPAAGFADAAEVLIKARQAADALGATRMDRAVSVAVSPGGAVALALAGHAARGTPAGPPVDGANPRANNSMGHLLSWQEAGDADATAFNWRVLALAGDPAAERDEAKGNLRGDAFAVPRVLSFDARGLLWIGTGITSDTTDAARLGNNAVLACDTANGEFRRMFAAPSGASIAGLSSTADGRTLFVDLKDAGELPGAARPRSATLALVRADGGVLGAA